MQRRGCATRDEWGVACMRRMHIHGGRFIGPHVGRGSRWE
jgi:hypothetical protein